jgi:hypothetical protein
MTKLLIASILVFIILCGCRTDRWVCGRDDFNNEQFEDIPDDKINVESPELIKPEETYKEKE